MGDGKAILPETPDLLRNYESPLPFTESRKKINPPFVMNERARPLSTRVLEDPMEDIRRAIEFFTRPNDHQTVTFSVHWRLDQYIRQEFEETPNLAHVLTVSGSAGIVYRTTCAEYVNSVWPATGLWMFETLQMFMDRGSRRKLANKSRLMNPAHQTRGYNDHGC